MKLLKWIALLLCTECFIYKETGFGFSFQAGLAVTPDRFVFLVGILLVIWSCMNGELRLAGLGKGGTYTLVLALICTVSAFTLGRGATDYYRLFDFHYNPLIVFLVAKSLSHSQKKLQFLSHTFLGLGAYLAINGIFERYGPQSLVWPGYILDPGVGIQFGRTRGSFASSEALGAALVVTFLFYSLYATRATGLRRYASHAMVMVTIVTIYSANQRAAWMGLALCLGGLAVSRTKMRWGARALVAAGLLVVISGAATHLSIWERSLFEKRQQTVRERWVNNLTTLDMGLANPIFGVGYGNFKTEWPKYYHQIYDDVVDLTDGNHNTFLGLFAEVGLVGLVPFLLILYQMFGTGLRVYRRSEGLEREFALVFLLAATSYVVGANFSDYRNAQFCNTTLFLLFGTVACIDAHMRASSNGLGVSRRSIRLAVPESGDEASLRGGASR